MSKRSQGNKDQKAAQASRPTLSHSPFGALADLDAPSPPGAAHPAEAAVPEAARVELTQAERFPKKLVVRMEKKGRRGKAVTRITGIPGADIKSLAIEMKKALGCGAMVEGPDLVLQGALVDRAASWLEKQGARQLVKG